LEELKRKYLKQAQAEKAPMQSAIQKLKNKEKK